MSRLPFLALVLVAAAARLSHAQERGVAADDSLIGIWGVEAHFGPEVRGQLLLDRVGDEWTVRIAGYEATRGGAADTVTIALPGGQGELRLRGGGNPGTSPRAFWIQPGGNLGRFATPVDLRRTGPGSWTGEVAPLDDRFALYLDIARDSAGALRGTFHNPDFNWTGRAPWFTIVREGDALRLIDGRTRRERFRQPYDAEQRRITMDFGAPIALVPKTIEVAPGLVPRIGAGPYRYRVPAAADEWRTARAADVGLDERKLEALIDSLAQATVPSASAPRIHSVLVARRGALVLEEYFFGYSADRVHDLRSASKSFTSILAGIAMDRGAAFSMDSPIRPLLGAPPRGDARLERITLGHLLTHRSGLACNDDDGESPGNEDVMQQQDSQPDWHAYTLGLPAVHEPGTVYAYCSGGINLVGAAIARATGAPLLEFFDRFLAEPLGIRRYHVNLMPTGEAYAAGGIRMRPRDLLRIGQLYLDGGEWKGKRIVSREWIARSTAHRSEVPGGGSDGYGWHRHRLSAGGRSYDAIEASGNGGQFLVLIPALDLAIVLTGGNYGQGIIWQRFRTELIAAFILAAARDER